MADPDNTTKLKAQQKANYQGLLQVAKILGPALLTAIAIILIPVALVFLAIHFGPWIVLLAMLTVLTSLALTWFFKPSLQLYSYRLWNKIKGNKAQ